VRILVLSVLTVAIASGCSLVAGVAPAATPAACRQALSAARCTAIADRLAVDAGVQREDVITMEILPDPTPGVRDGMTILRTTSGGPSPEVRVTYADGTVDIVTLHCGGIASNSVPECMDDPSLGVGPQDALGGYHDVPEGSTPVPTLDPVAVRAGRPLRIDELEIPITRTGVQEVPIGDALVPNGVLRQAVFTLADDWPEDVTILEGGVRLEIRGEDGAVIWNVYDHGWRTGPERVEAFLVFKVSRFEPGATLGIRNVFVK
jgi:hypothetical protein